MIFHTAKCFHRIPKSGARRHSAGFVKTALSLASVFLVCMGMATSARAASLRIGPYLANPRETGIDVCWETDAPAAVQVVYSPVDKSAPAAARDVAAISNNACAALDGLASSAAYNYRLVVDGKSTKAFRFRTAKRANEDFTFVVYGDSRSHPDKHARVIAAIANSQPDLFLNTGDFVDHGNIQSEWDDFFRVVVPLAATTPFYPVIGNHEKQDSRILRYFPLPNRKTFYAFSYGGCRFIVLDSDYSKATSVVERKFLEKELAASAGARFTFVLFHAPPYSSGHHGGDNQILKLWTPIIARYSPDIVFNGHDHDYERIHADGVTYVITGGGGAELRPIKTQNSFTVASGSLYHFTRVRVSGDRITFEAVDTAGKVFDRFEATAKAR